MNLNDFVVLPNNKAKSVKLNARNLQALQMETVTLAEESKDMEEKLQQLKESMSKEKEERGHSGGFKWKSGQRCSLNINALTNSVKKNKEDKFQKLSAGKVRIRVLKDEPLIAPPPPPPPATVGTCRRNRLKGVYCGQCEVRTAGLMCAECTEDYCAGCFTKFHQKGALKLHRMIPIQADLQTHVSTRDVVSCFQKQINLSCYPSTFMDPNPNPSPNSKPNINYTLRSNGRRGDESPEKGTETEASVQLHNDPSQVLAVNHRVQKKGEMTEERPKREDDGGFPTSLLRGEYSEEESARSFQEALRQWRGERKVGAGEPMREAAMWTPVRPVSVSVMAIQADLTPDRGAEGQGRGEGEGRVPVRVEFIENSLTYMDRLLLKKHRRTPIKTYQPLLTCATKVEPLPYTDREEETASNLTAPEEDFRRYCASLFAVPASRGSPEPQMTPPASCLVIEVLDEREGDADGDLTPKETTVNSREAPSVQQDPSKERTPVPQTALSSGVHSRVSHSSPTPIQPSRQYRAPAQPKAAQKPQTSQAEQSMKSLSSKSKTSACPTAKTPRTSKTSIKTPTSASQKPNCSPTVHESKPHHRTPHTQNKIPKSTHPSASFPLDVSPSTCATPPIPEEHLSPSPSFSLRSTFTVSPSSSTESTLLPKVYQSNHLQKGSNSFLLPPDQPRSPQLLPEPISSPKLSQSRSSNLESPRERSSCDPQFLQSHNQLQLTLSPLSSSPTSQPRSLEASPSVKALSSVSPFNKSPPDAYFKQWSAPTKAAPGFMSSTPISDDHESTLSCQDTQRIPRVPSHLSNVIQNHLAVKKEEEEELSEDGGDEMSSDSLSLAAHEEDSSEEEARVHGPLTRGRSREEERGNPAISHLQDRFVPAHAERAEDLQTDEHEQLSEPSTVMHRQSVGSGSELSCDLDEFLPLGLDVHSGHSDTPEHTHGDSLHISQTSSYGSDPEDLESLAAEKRLALRMVKNNHTEPTTHTRRQEILAAQPRTSGSGFHLSGESTPTLCHPPRTSPSPLSAPRSLSLSLSPPLSACRPRPTRGSQPGPEFRPLSRAAQEIMEICSLDRTGCEDPDLDTDTTAHTLRGLEQELRLITEETGKQASVFATGNGNQSGDHRFTWGRVSEEEKDEEAAAQRDRQSVLLLP